MFHVDTGSYLLCAVDPANWSLLKSSAGEEVGCTHRLNSNPRVWVTKKLAVACKVTHHQQPCQDGLIHIIHITHKILVSLILIFFSPTASVSNGTILWYSTMPERRCIIPYFMSSPTRNVTPKKSNKNYFSHQADHFRSSGIMSMINLFFKNQSFVLEGLLIILKSDKCFQKCRERRNKQSNLLNLSGSLSMQNLGIAVDLLPSYAVWTGSLARCEYKSIIG